MKRLPFGFSFLMLLCIQNVCFAQFTSYGDDTRDQWFIDAGGEDNITTIDFTDLPNATTVTDQYAGLGVTFEGLNFTSGPFTNYHDLWGIRIFNGNDLYFDEPIYWIAADYVGTLRLDIYSGENFLHRFEQNSLHDFVGGISTIPFDHVRIYDPVDFLAVVDDLHFGPPIAVPVPGAFAPFALALVVRGQRKRA